MPTQPLPKAAVVPPTRAPATPRMWKNSLFNLVAFLWPLVLMLVSTRYLLRTLGEARYGTWLVANAFLSLAGFTQFGLNEATTYFVSKHEAAGERLLAREAAAATLLSYGAIGAAASVVLFLAAPRLVMWFVRPEVATDAVEALRLVRVVVWAFPLALVMGGVRATAAGLQRYWVSMLAELTRATLWTSISVLAVWFGMGLVPLALATLVAYVAAATVGMVLLAHTGFRMPLLSLPRRPLLKQMLSYGGWSWGAAMGALSYSVLDRLLLGHMLGRAVVTQYAVPQGLGQRLHSLVQTVMHVVFPNVGAKGNNPAALARFYAKSHTVVLLLAGAMVCGAALSGEAVFTLWVGASFAAKAAPVFHWLLVTVGLSVCGMVPYYTLLGTGRPHVVAGCVLLGGVLFLGVAMLVTPRYGVLGFAAASTLFATNNLMHWFAVPSRDTAKTVIYTTLVAAACFLVSLYLGWRLRLALLAWHAIAAGFVAGSAAAMMYLLAVAGLLHRRPALWPQLRLPKRPDR